MTSLDAQAELDSAEFAPPETAGGEKPAGSSRWWILAVACLAQLVVVLDATIVNIALPSAQTALGFSDENRQWVVTAYALAFGALLLVGGRLGDLIGRKQVFIIGMAGFAAASAIGGASESFGMLVAARAGQGVFGAILAPAALSLVTTTFTVPHERGRAFAIYGALAGGGGAIGLLLGGALTEYLSWRWCLYVNVPIVLVAVVAAVLLLPGTRRDRGATLDVPGAVLSVLGLVGVVYGLANAESHGWGDPATYGFIVAGVAVLAVFVLVELRVGDPLLPMSVLTDRNRGGSFIAVGATGAGMFGVFLFLTYYLTVVMGYGALPTGLAFLPMIFSIAISAQLAPTLVERIGAKVPVSLGFAVAAVGMVLLSRLEIDSSYAGGVLPGLIVTGLGLGMVLAPSMAAATDRVAPDHAGVASAAVNTFQQIGGSIGTAVLSALAATAASDYLIGKDAGDPSVLASAALESYRTAFGVSALIFAAGAVVSFLIFRHGALERDPDAVVIGH